MTRGKWLGVVVAAALAIAAVGGYAGWQAWQGRCAAEFAESDPTGPPHVTSAEQLEPTVNELIEEGRADDGAERIADDVALALSPHTPFGEPRAAVIHPDNPQLAGAGALIQHSPISVTDGLAAEVKWERAQPHTSYAGQPMGDDVVLTHVTDQGELAIAVVDRDSGDITECNRTADDVGVSGIEVRMADRAIVDDRTAAITYGHTDDALTLAVTDVHNGEILWSRTESREELSDFIHRAGDVLVTSHVGDGLQNGWDAVTDGGRRFSREWLRLHAFAVDDGAQAWDYALEDAEGGDPFTHQIVGTTDDLIVVRASRLDDATDMIENHLLALDAETGTLTWSEDIAPVGSGYYSTAGLFDDVVVVAEADEATNHRSGWLVGYDVATGDELWRVGNQTTDTLEESVVIDNAVAIPGLSQRGLELIDLESGNSETHFDGISVTAVIADETTIGVTVFINGDPTLIVYDRI